MKRAQDLVLASLGLIALGPLLLILVVAIRLDSRGPGIFRQRRVGLHGQEFEILKLRTMRVTDGGPHLTTATDPRITRLGRWLRSTKLDELPQLLNVLRGEMSLVGPRPELPHYVALWPEHTRRMVLSVRPGITDPASLEFRRESEVLATVSDAEHHYVSVIMPRKLELHADYVANRSTVGDLRILLRTLGAAVVR